MLTAIIAVAVALALLLPLLGICLWSLIIAARRWARRARQLRRLTVVRIEGAAK